MDLPGGAFSEIVAGSASPAFGVEFPPTLVLISCKTGVDSPEGRFGMLFAVFSASCI